ncbi:MAG: GNAT family N-acetyltransferase [Actinomycetota bacterium]
MKVEFRAVRAKPEDWQRVAKLRLRALADSPQWFAGDFGKESNRSEEEWRSLIEEMHWIIFTVSDEDVGMMVVQKGDEVRNADSWLWGCWAEPRYRGQGVTKRMIEELDLICRNEGWVTQGLGVWPNNEVAIRAYERCGFEKRGEPQFSRSKPDQLYQKMTRTLKH